MGLAHVELIKPSEKLSGYLPPSRSATLPELAAAVRAGQVVWKVDRASVNWRRPADIRLLNLGEVRVKCRVLGGTGYGRGKGYWFFVVVVD